MTHTYVLIQKKETGPKAGQVLHGLNYGALSGLSDAELDAIIAALNAAATQVWTMKGQE